MYDAEPPQGQDLSLRLPVHRDYPSKRHGTRATLTGIKPDRTAKGQMCDAGVAIHPPHGALGSSVLAPASEGRTCNTAAPEPSPGTRMPCSRHGGPGPLHGGLGQQRCQLRSQRLQQTGSASALGEYPAGHLAASSSVQALASAGTPLRECGCPTPPQNASMCSHKWRRPAVDPLGCMQQPAGWLCEPLLRRGPTRASTWSP